MRKVTQLQKETEYGYKLVASFIQDTNERGVTNYYLRVVEKWVDGHETLRPNGYIDFRTDKDFGNSMYKRYRQEGYTPLDSYEFEPTKMDIR